MSIARISLLPGLLAALAAGSFPACGEKDEEEDGGSATDADTDADMDADTDTDTDTDADTDNDAGTDTDTDTDSDSGSDSDTLAASCEAQFEPVVLCEAEEGACTFYVELGGSSCAAYCAAHGGECLASAWNEPGPDPCIVQEAATCDDVASDQICTCSP